MNPNPPAPDRAAQRRALANDIAILIRRKLRRTAQSKPDSTTIPASQANPPSRPSDKAADA